MEKFRLLNKSPSEQLGPFLHGLKPELCQFVISRTPSSIDQAINLARLAKSLGSMNTMVPAAAPVVHQAQPDEADLSKLLHAICCSKMSMPLNRHRTPNLPNVVRIAHIAIGKATSEKIVSND
jgi:L-cysteine desulfidase